MANRPRRWIGLAGIPLASLLLVGQTVNHGPRVVPAQPLDPSEPKGERPYEMVLANRQPVHEPLVNFDSLDGWTLESEEGATGTLGVSQQQQLWESPVARLAYSGSSEKSQVTLRPPSPIAIPEPVSATTIWIYGNNWGWVPDPTTPQVTVVLLLRDASGEEHDLELTRVRWREWWLVHRVIPSELLTKVPLSLTGIQIQGCANQEERELYFEDLAFFAEESEPLTFLPRPRRGIDLFEGQSPGANTGPGRLPFPTRETTILPENFEDRFRTDLEFSESEQRFGLIYQGRDAHLEYRLKAENNYWGPVEVVLNGMRVGQALIEAGPVFPEPLEGLQLTRAWQEGSTARAQWTGRLEGRTVVVDSSVQLWQKSLVVDFVCRGGHAAGLSYGSFTGVPQPTLIAIPYLNYEGHHLNVLMASGMPPFFASVWMDWYLSNASVPYATDEIEGDKINLNGGVRYLPKTDGTRNDLFERFFLTVSPTFEETLPTIPNPPAKDGKVAGSRLWQETWGPQDYQKEIERSRRLRAYGIEMLTQCNHEITWRDGGESFTFRTMAAPGKGGDEALQEYVAAQKSLGWRSGLYTNYTDYAPVNANWDIDMVMRKPSGDLVTAWPRCYSPKALFAVEMDRKLAPQIQKKYGSNAAYTDVHTSVSPWSRTDYDARVPGAGTFAATFYAYGELLLHDQEVYDHHCWSEGHHQWLYAGLTTGNYALTYGEMNYREHPYLPHFDLLKMHPLSVDIGMPWTARFFEGVEGWREPENIERSIDQFLAATIAYGHIGWLVEEIHGIRQTGRSYYMMQQLESRYVMERPLQIRYGTEFGLVDTSQALQSGTWKESKLYTRYANGLEVWVNGNGDEHWLVSRGSRDYDLPPYGWLALQGDDFFEGSLWRDGHRIDLVASPSYVFVDGRGKPTEFSGISTSGSVAVRPSEEGQGLSLVCVDAAGDVILSAPSGEFGWDDIRTRLAEVAAASSITAVGYDVEGSEVGQAQVRKQDGKWVIATAPQAVRYKVSTEDQ